METFFASGETKAPEFKYKGKASDFEKHSKVNMAFYDDAVRIIEKVIEEYSSPEEFMKQAYGQSNDKCSPEEFRDAALAYLQRLGLENQAEVKIVSMPLAMASVTKLESKYVVSIANTPVPRKMVTNILDHEVGTHLLRMMNDEHQVWYQSRKNHGLRGHWSTEEGLAMLNSLLSMDIKCLWSAALRYWTVCLASCLGFVELYHKLKPYVIDPKRCFRCCVRAKRGLRDTSLPGAFNADQCYFVGAMRILRSIDHIDFRLLYCGSIALEDLPSICFKARKQVIRLPEFLATDKDLQNYRRQLHLIRQANDIKTDPLPCLKRLMGPKFQFRYSWTENLRRSSRVAEASAAETEDEGTDDDDDVDSDEPNIVDSQGLFSNHSMLLQKTKSRECRPGLFFTPHSNQDREEQTIPRIPDKAALLAKSPAKSKPKVAKRHSVPALGASSRKSITNGSTSGRKLSLSSSTPGLKIPSGSTDGKLSLSNVSSASGQKVSLNSGSSRRKSMKSSLRKSLTATKGRRASRKSVTTSYCGRRSSIFRSPVEI